MPGSTEIGAGPPKKGSAAKKFVVVSVVAGGANVVAVDVEGASEVAVVAGSANEVAAVVGGANAGVVAGAMNAAGGPVIAVGVVVAREPNDGNKAAIADVEKRAVGGPNAAGGMDVAVNDAVGGTNAAVGAGAMNAAGGPVGALAGAVVAGTLESAGEDIF